MHHPHHHHRHQSAPRFLAAAQHLDGVLLLPTNERLSGLQIKSRRGERRCAGCSQLRSCLPVSGDQGEKGSAFERQSWINPHQPPLRDYRHQTSHQAGRGTASPSLISLTTKAKFTTITPSNNTTVRAMKNDSNIYQSHLRGGGFHDKRGIFLKGLNTL